MDSFTGKVVHTWSFDNFRTLIDDPVYRRIAFRTIWIAAAVTVTDAILAFPLAYFMARLATSRMRAVLFVLVLLPLWTSYLVRIYAWRLILAKEGALNWALNGIGLPDANLAYTNTAMWIVFSYVWLPFMVLPVYAALERIPQSYLEASQDLGARSFRTFRTVILPLALPAARRRLDLHLLADARRLHHACARRGRELAVHRKRRSQLRRHQQQRAARCCVRDPAGRIVMAVYLVIAKRLGAFEAL